MGFKDAAFSVLSKANEPLHYREITERALTEGLLETSGQTPDATMGAQLAVAVKRQGDESRFVRVKPGVYGLREWIAAGQIAPEETSPHHVRVPFFPNYDEVRAFLSAIEGMTRSSITALHSGLMQLTGTPQSNLDWTDPDTWIEKRLPVEHQEAARRIWEGTGRRVSPRHMLGHWLLSSGYELVQEGTQGSVGVNERGRDFCDNPTGRVVREIDESEGLLKLLSLIAESGPAQSGELMGPWTDYLARESRIRTEASARERLYHRLRNLKDRNLIERPGLAYGITPAGLEHLTAVGYEGDAAVGGESPDLWQLIDRQQARVRESLASLLGEMDPIAFEHLIKELLEKMGYEEVEVTAPSNDGGVDVVGRIQMGITTVREVVQVKRHASNIRRPVLDQLRGLYIGSTRFGVRSSRRPTLLEVWSKRPWSPGRRR